MNVPPSTHRQAVRFVFHCGKVGSYSLALIYRSHGVHYALAPMAAYFFLVKRGTALQISALAIDLQRRIRAIYFMRSDSGSLHAISSVDRNFLRSQGLP